MHVLEIIGQTSILLLVNLVDIAVSLQVFLHSFFGFSNFLELETFLLYLRSRNQPFSRVRLLEHCGEKLTAFTLCRVWFNDKSEEAKS